jgi:hypothetical protein
LALAVQGAFGRRGLTDLVSPPRGLIHIKARTAGRSDTEIMLKPSLARDVAMVTTVKVIVAIAAAVLVFGPGQRPRMDADVVTARLIGSADAHANARTIVP